MDRGDVETALTRFFAAIEQGDEATVAAMYHDDVRVWNSGMQRAADKRHNLVILRWLMTPGVRRRYETVEQHISDLRVYRRHILHLDVEGFEPLTIPAAIFVTFDDEGLITAIDEYVDSSWSDLLVARIPPGRR